MMFVRAFTLVSVAVLAGLVSAAPADLEVRGGSSTCNSGSVQCCSGVQQSDTEFVGTLFGYLGIPLPASGIQVGLTCSPITVGGTGSGATCTQQTVCCNGNTFNGVIVTGCSPITINA